MREESEAFGSIHGYSPLARKVVCIDFDQTLFKWGKIFELTDVMPGAVEAVQCLKDSGYRIVIFTSRLSPTWLKAEYGRENWTEAKWAQVRFIQKRLNDLDIPFDDITAEKIPAEAYIDDRAIRFKGDNWHKIAERLCLGE